MFRTPRKERIDYKEGGNRPPFGTEQWHPMEMIRKLRIYDISDKECIQEISNMNIVSGLLEITTQVLWEAMTPKEDESRLLCRHVVNPCMKKSMLNENIQH